MRFAIPEVVRLTSIKILTATEARKAMTFASIANKETFEVLETKLALLDGQTMDSIVEGKDYLAVVEYDGKWGSVSLTPATGTKPLNLSLKS